MNAKTFILSLCSILKKIDIAFMLKKIQNMYGSSSGGRNNK
jgi:hypothetical protein